MILIAAPQKITVDSGNPTDSVAVTREALPTPDESLLKTPERLRNWFSNGRRATPAIRTKLIWLTAMDHCRTEYRLAADPADEVAANESSSDALPLGAWLPEAETAEPLPPPRVSRCRCEHSSRARQTPSIAGALATRDVGRHHRPVQCADCDRYRRSLSSAG